MTMELRGYQSEAKADIYNAWHAGAINVLGELPTGSGKTVLFSSIINDTKGAVCAVAHRQELVGQISISLARFGVYHRIIAPPKVIRFITQHHREELGRSYYNPTALVAVAGVDTLIRRQDELAAWANQVVLWVMDEAHHVLVKNKWGAACRMFPNARGLGVTATPCRADGRGLGRHADGYFDTLIHGPTMRELIDVGFLTDYRIFAPPSDFDVSNITLSDATGDFNRVQMAREAKRSHIVGDVVESYLKFARGKLGVTFATDVETASSIARKYNEAGVPAQVVSAKTPDRERVAALRRFARREILQLVNVDLFGEGFDLPAIECISMARPTQSWALFVQQFGRVLRILEGKARGIILDHVGNVARHAAARGLPDTPQQYTLDRREKRAKNAPGEIPVKTCGNPACVSVYEAIHRGCPYCGHVNEPAGRSAPEFVDGDLMELDAEALEALRGDVAKVDESPLAVQNRFKHAGAPIVAMKGAAAAQRRRQEVQGELRASMKLWAGIQKALGRGESEIHKRFYFRYGCDVLTAQALGKNEAATLAERVNGDIWRGAA